MTMSMAAAPVQENISVFWDYESTRSSNAAASLSTYDIVKNIRSAVDLFGNIQSIRAYADFTGQSSPRFKDTRSELSSSGITLVDCPSSGRREASARMLVVDMIIHAWDHPPPHTFALITSDRDMAYMVATLQTRKHRVILVSPVGTHQDLTSQASVNLDLTRSILGISGSMGVGNTLQESMARASNSFASAQPLPPTSFTSGLQQRSDFHGFGIQEDKPLGSAVTDPYDIPARARRNSLYSRGYEGDIFGGFKDIFSLPAKAHSGGFDLGEGPLFPRDSRQAARADSAPPGIIYSADVTPPTTIFGQGDAVGTSMPHLGASTTASKGKQRDFPISEPEEIAPAPPPPTNQNKFTFSGNFQIPSEPELQSHSPGINGSRKRELDLVHSPSSISSSSASEDSVFSLVDRPPPSTAPTSAEPVTITNKSSSPFGSPAKQQTVVLKAAEAVPVYVPPSRRNSISPSINRKEGEKTDISSFMAPGAAALPNSGSPVLSAKTSAFTPRQSPPHFAKVTIGTSTIIQPPAGIGKPSSGFSSLKVPPQFQILVTVLRRLAPEGGFVAKSALGGALLKQDPSVYKKAGQNKLSGYITAAAGAGIVREGIDTQRQVAVALNAQYLQG